MWAPLRPKCPIKYKNTKHLAKQEKEKRKTPFVNGSAGAYETRVQKFRLLSLKNGVDIGH